MTPYYEGFVRARRTLPTTVDHSKVDEIVLRTPVRVRVGLSLVSLGNQLIGVTDSIKRPEVRSAA
ncbi:MAG: hypothetical protein R3246_07715 [Acidimicrobiia bacterium]|nr:hypothetical protein [Acidimicrobiia bacterium]